ncbi:MAG: hypothetical protein M1812_005336 [Candelaria pacifica]|nr:MAG: hypothetical protein M1812_005336 [Candelaria pacifica]
MNISHELDVRQSPSLLRRPSSRGTLVSEDSAYQGPSLNDTQEEPLDRQSLYPSNNSKTTKTFNSAHQSRNLLLKGGLRWVGTLVLTALIALTLRIYEAKNNFPAHEKTVFNTIITAWIVGWGLNLFEACKESASIMRWRILAEAPHTKKEVDLILAIESLLSVFTLGRKSFRKPKMLIPCILWLLWNLIAQVAVASVSLTYTLDDGTSWKDTYSTDGMVNAPNLTTYFRGKRPLTHESDQDVAHTYGEVAQDHCEPYEDIAQVYNSTEAHQYFCRRLPGMNEYAYRFNEYNINDTIRAYASFTNRVITASSGKCYKYDQLEGTKPTLGKDVYGHMAAWNNTFSNSSNYRSNILIPASSEGGTATVYIYRGLKLPSEDEENACGDRCIWLWAHRTSISLDSSSTFFQCPITISEVSNATKPFYHVPDSVARMAAASISLQGRWSGHSDNKIWTQYQFYPVFNRWETHHLEDEKAGSNMAEFALRSLAVMAERNPIIQIPSQVPHLGTRLKVYNHWRYLLILLLCIVAGHFALFVAAIWLARSVVVADNSFVTVAKLLSGAVRQSQDSEEGHDAVSPSYTRERFVYGPLALEDESFVLALSEKVKTLKQWPGGRHLDVIRLDSY